jgi:hypothetical protein
MLACNLWEYAKVPCCRGGLSYEDIVLLPSLGILSSSVNRPTHVRNPKNTLSTKITISYVRTSPRKRDVLASPCIHLFISSGLFVHLTPESYLSMLSSTLKSPCHGPIGAYFIKQPIPDRGHIWMPRVVSPILKAPVFLVRKGYVCISGYHGTTDQ